MMEYLPPALATAAFRRQARRADRNKLMNVAVSSVPGPVSTVASAMAPATRAG